MIMLDSSTRVIVQGITGKQGTFHTEQMLKYGTKIVGGTSPGKRGTNVLGVPVFETIEEAPSADASVIFVPAPFAKDAVFEAVDAGLKLIVLITERIPVHDSLEMIKLVKEKGVTMIGPNTPGIIRPSADGVARRCGCKMGIMPHSVFSAGHVGVVSRSGTLTYEIVNALTDAGMGQSLCIGVGGDLVNGTNFREALEIFNNDQATKKIVLIGEIGGNAEEKAAEIIPKMGKPVVAYIAGRYAPEGKRMGHAGAIVSGTAGTAAEKVRVLEAAGAKVAKTPWEVPALVEHL